MMTVSKRETRSTGSGLPDGPQTFYKYFDILSLSHPFYLFTELSKEPLYLVSSPSGFNIRPILCFGDMKLYLQTI